MIKIENKLLNFHKRYDAATDNGPRIVKIETNLQKGMESKTFLQNTSVKEVPPRPPHVINFFFFWDPNTHVYCDVKHI